MITSVRFSISVYNVPQSDMSRIDIVGADIEHSHPEARNDLIKWGKWVINEIGACGFRFDAVKVCSVNIVLPLICAPLYTDTG